jgi:hypothetical protein
MYMHTYANSNIFHYLKKKVHIHPKKNVDMEDLEQVFLKISCHKNLWNRMKICLTPWTTNCPIQNPIFNLSLISYTSGVESGQFVVAKIISNLKLSWANLEIECLMFETWISCSPIDFNWMQHDDPLSNDFIVLKCKEVLESHNLFNYFNIHATIFLIEDLLQLVYGKILNNSWFNTHCMCVLQVAWKKKVQALFTNWIYHPPAPPPLYPPHIWCMV